MKIAELNQEAWEEWAATRPKVVQDLCRRFPPDRLYLLKPNNQKVTIIAYSEDGTLRVHVGGQYNFVVFEREVFGIDPDNLEECEAPVKGKTGTLLNKPEEVDALGALFRQQSP